MLEFLAYFMMVKKTKTAALFQNLQLELSERLHHREQRDRSRSVDSARREDAAAPPPLSGGSASVDRRKHGVLLTNGGGGGGGNVLLDLMAVPPPCNGRPGRSPARSRASEDETADNGGYSKGRRVQVAENSAAQQQKRLTSALDSNLNELMVGSCSNAALEGGKPRGSRGSRTKSESRAGDREEARRAQQTNTHNGDAECFLQVGLYSQSWGSYCLPFPLKISFLL
jgi:hypothetical protein